MAVKTSSALLGKALLPLQGSGKVHVGQRVHIRLNNYPDQEFGYVKGQVASISPAPTEEGMYIVEITLPDGMQTNYGKQLPVSRELKGTTCRQNLWKSVRRLCHTHASGKRRHLYPALNMRIEKSMSSPNLIFENPPNAI